MCAGPVHERETVIQCCQGRICDIRACLAQAHAEKCDYPAPLIRYMQTNQEGRPSGFSVTQVVGCMRKHALSKTTTIIESPKDYLALFRGEARHIAAEKYGDTGDGVVMEARVYRDYDGVPISGKFDRLVIQEGDGDTVLVDWKDTASDPKQPYAHHVAQLNLYTWLLADGRDAEGRPYQIHVDRARLHYFTPRGHVAYNVPLWTDEGLHRYLQPRMEVLRAWLDEETLPPVVEKDEAWQCRYCALRDRCVKEQERGR